VLPLHHGHHEAGTTGLEPAASRLTSECSARLSYAPEECAGGIRTHGLELMRLARTTAPLPRSLAGRSRTCDLRRPKPAGCPTPLQPEDDRRTPPAGLEPAASGLRARRHRRFDHGGICCRARWGSADADPHRARSLKPAARAAGRGRSPARRHSSGGRARTCALAGNNRASCQLDHAGTNSGRRGSRTPKARRAHPFSRRDTAPVAVLPKRPRQASNLHRPG
jgi:hypothetical protein